MSCTCIKGVFIFTTNGELVFSHRFPCMLKIPDNSVLQKFFEENVMKSPNPMNSYHINEETELLVYPLKSLTLSCVPLLQSNPKIDIAGAYSFLSFLEVISRSTIRSVGTDYKNSLNWAPLRQYLNLVMPYGTPIIADPYFLGQLSTISDVRRLSAGYQTIAPAPIPTWKTNLLFPKQSLKLIVKETVYGNNAEFKVYGELVCVSSISYLPEITLPINNIKDIKKITCAQCVKQINESSIVFLPMTGITQLLTWEADNKGEPPVVGEYRVQQDGKQIHFSFKVNSHPPVKSMIATFPFHDRGQLLNHTLNSNAGQTKASKKDATIMWNINQPSAEISGDLEFENESDAILRAYISFKDKNDSYTGKMVDVSGIKFKQPVMQIDISSEESYSSDSKRYFVQQIV